MLLTDADTKKNKKRIKLKCLLGYRVHIFDYAQMYTCMVSTYMWFEIDILYL